MQRGPIGYVTLLYIPIRLCYDIIINFLKLSPVFTTCSVLYPNLPASEDHLNCISQLWMIVDKLSVFQFLITVPGNLSDKQCPTTFDTDVVLTIGYLYCIVFDRDTLFMLSDFQSWAASKGIKLESSTAYHI